jgi:putative oxidoreductase
MTTMLTSSFRTRAGFLVLSWTVAGLMLLHGISKLVHGVGFVEGLVTANGMPAFFAYGVFVGEVLAPLLVLAGIFVVPAALVMAFNMAVAVALVHTAQFLTLGQTGGWALELQAFYFFGSLSIALLAPAKLTDIPAWMSRGRSAARAQRA